MPGAIYVLYLTLGLEFFGITHFSWLITILTKKATSLNKNHPMCIDVLRADEGSGGYSGWLLDPKQENLVIRVDKEDDIYKDKGEDKTTDPTQKDSSPSEVQVYVDDGEVDGENKWPSTPKPDQYPTPQAVVKGLVEQQLPVPRFLLPPYHPSHIPPHVVACSLVFRGQWSEQDGLPTNLVSFSATGGTEPIEWGDKFGSSEKNVSTRSCQCT